MTRPPDATTAMSSSEHASKVAKKPGSAQPNECPEQNSDQAASFGEPVMTMKTSPEANLSYARMKERKASLEDEERRGQYWPHIPFPYAVEKKGVLRCNENSVQSSIEIDVAVDDI